MRLQKKLLCFGLLFIACQVNPFLIEPTQPSRPIAQTNLRLSEIWRVSDLVIWATGNQPANLILTNKQLVAVNHRAGVRSGKVISFNTNDGMKLLEFDYNKQYVSSMTNNQDSLFIASPGEPINAYSLQTGQTVWTTDVKLASRATNDLHLQDGILFNYSFKNQVETIQKFDPDTGILLNSQDSSIAQRAVDVLVMRLGSVELRSTPYQLLKINSATGKAFWGAPKEYGATQRFPILSENKLIIVSGRINLAIDVVDYTTGEHLWQAEGIFVSNAAVNKSKVYVLRDDARLVVLDLATGVELGYVQFIPEMTDATENAYWVGVDEQERIFVYFGDSQEVIALAPPVP